MSRYQRLLLATLSTFLISNVHAAAYQLYELGTPIIGTAGVGQAAVADDASTAYFNPAGMPYLNGSQFMLGSQMMVPEIHFSRNNSTTISGDNGGNAGSLLPGLDVYYVYGITDDLKLGISLTTPFGGALSYNDGWVGRYNVQNVMFYTINLNPSLAYRFNQYLSLGIGGAIEYINLQNTVALPVAPDIDGQAKITAANFAPGFNIGLMITPYDSTRIGIAYRSQIIHQLSGSVTFLRIGDTPNVSTRMVMPAEVIISLSQQMSERIRGLAELGWANWSSMRNVVASVGGYTGSSSLNWKDTYRIGLGTQIECTRALFLQLGASYDTSPTNASRRTPVLPMDNQLRIGAGVAYHLRNAVTLGASYEYINFGSAQINNVSTNGTLAGSYRTNYANVVQVSLNTAL